MIRFSHGAASGVECVGIDNLVSFVRRTYMHGTAPVQPRHQRPHDAFIRIGEGLGVRIVRCKLAQGTGQLDGGSKLLLLLPYQEYQT